MPDPDQTHAHALVELAHRSLVDARRATLLVDGTGPLGADDGVTLSERYGCPVLLCAADGALAGVVGTGRAAVLTVPTPSLGASGSVIFLCRMTRSATYGSGAESTAMLELVPASIVVEPTVEGGPHGHVDLPRYTEHCRRAACCRTSGDPVAVGAEQ